MCIFDIFDIRNYIEITCLVMPKPVYLLTMQEAYKSLTDQIQDKYEQLDSGEYGAVGTPAFNAEACELANLFACVSPHSSSIEEHLLDMSTPSVLRIGDWLCILPAITLLV